MVNTRYNIIRIKVESPKQIVHFQHKIPTYLKRCTGFLVKHVKGINSEHCMAEIGWITASFNSLKHEKLVAPVSVQAIYALEEPFGYQSLDVALKPGQLLVGVYIDTLEEKEFSPYTVSLYLRCVAENFKPIDPKIQSVFKQDIPVNPWLRSEFIFQDETTMDDEIEQSITTEHENQDQLCMTN